MPEQPRPGDRFGRYRIDRTIGVGGMGVVLEAHDETLGRRVALKVVAARLGGTDEFRRRFEREASLLARLDSPHVIAIYDYGSNDDGSHQDVPYIATQYVAGGDLESYLATHGPLAPAAALRLCAQIAEALDDAHRVGVVHRDVKPTNVLLRDAEVDPAELHAYLCDFGIARTENDGLTQPGAISGTWTYLAPEVARGAPAAPASDIYALGCLLWTTLTGKPPYLGTPVEAARGHQRAAVRQIPASTPFITALNALLATAMAKDPSHRFPTADAFRAALLATAADPGAQASLPPVPAGRSGALPMLAPAPTAARTPQLSTAAHAPAQTAAPASTQPASSGRRRRRGRLIALIAVIVAIATGVGVALVANARQDDAPPGGEGSAADPQKQITGDIDGDGFGDLRLLFQPDATAVQTASWSSDGTSLSGGEVQDIPAVAPDYFARQLLGDLDGDGRVEPVTLTDNADNTAIRVSADLSGGETLETELPGEPQPRAYALADIDRDGRADLLSIDYADETRETVEVATWAFDGSTFAAPVVRAPIGGIANLSTALGDVDGDGDPDLITLVMDATDPDLESTGTLSVRLGDGESGFAEPVEHRVFRGSRDVIVRAADVDADGSDEILIGEFEGDFMTLTALEMTAGAIAESSFVGQFRFNRLSGNAFDIGVVDVDGDGRDDIVSADLAPRRDGVRILVGLSTGSGLVTRRWLRWDYVVAVEEGRHALYIVGASQW